MNHFKQSNKKLKLENTVHFIFVALLPVIGVVTIFVYAFMYVKNDVDFTQKQLAGLALIEQIEESIFVLQRLRGMSEIIECGCEKDEVSLQKEIQSLQQNAKKRFTILKATLKNEYEPSLNGQFRRFLQEVETTITQSDFEILSAAIKEMIYFSNQIAYRYNLKLEPNLKPFVLVENSVDLLPKLIEYNGQIRAKASGVTHNGLNNEQKMHIQMQLHKIDERLAEIGFNHKIVCSNGEYVKIEAAYKKMLLAQNEIIATVQKRYLNGLANGIGGKDIFDAVTAGMEHMIRLQRINLGTLQGLLTKRLAQKSALLKATLFIGAAALFFIIYMNYLFYKENKKLIETVEKMSMSDGLTKLHNRRAFDMVFDRYLSFTQREKKSLVFMLIDIDFFKQYNDTYGHQAGDEALQKVAQCLQKNLKRDSDEVFRLGGEEFGVLALDMDANNAYDFAENLRENIENLGIEHKHNKASKYVTISVGVHIASYADKRDKTAFYKMADDALYRSKQEGRNRVTITSKES